MFLHPFLSEHTNVLPVNSDKIFGQKGLPERTVRLRIPLPTLSAHTTRTPMSTFSPFPSPPPCPTPSQSASESYSLCPHTHTRIVSCFTLHCLFPLLRKTIYAVAVFASSDLVAQICCAYMLSCVLEDLPIRWYVFPSKSFSLPHCWR